MNIFLNEYFGFCFELNFELNHFQARFNEKMNFQKRSPTPKSSPIMTLLQSNIFPHNITSSSHSIIVGSAATFVWQHFVSQRCEIDFSNCTTYVWQHLKLFRSARTSYRASVRPPVPSRPVHPQQFFLSS